MFRKILGFLAFVAFASTLILVGVGFWVYNYLVRDLPRFNRVEDYRPAAVSQVYARDGTLVAEFYTEEGRRYPIAVADIPDHVKKAFLAAEDASFYEHKGIDPISIIRAVYTNLKQGSAKQGGSTITQQVVKNLLLTPEKKLERKAKEAILSFQLETRLSKDEILQLYLNQIFFGNRAYGIKAAAKHYFRKEVSELSIAQAALLAGLPKAPSNFSPLANPKAALRRQAYVLSQMYKVNFITKDQYEQATKEKIEVYAAPQQNIFHAPFYVTQVRKALADKFPGLEPDVDGLRIDTALDIRADRMAARNLRQGLREVDKRRGWRGPIASIKDASADGFYNKFPEARKGIVAENEPVPAMVLETASKAGKGKVVVLLGEERIAVDVSASSWASRLLSHDQSSRSVDVAGMLKAGDVIEVALRKKLGKGQPADAKEILLDQTPEIEGALSLVNPFNGEVIVSYGGYDYARSQFNRATQSLRQPGSTFKPILYLAAVDGFKYTPATIVDDSPRTFKVGDQYWTPSNFDESFLGHLTLRVALEKSRNLVSADLVSKIGVESVIQYARKLGIENKLGFNLSIALGSSEVTLLELVRAYGVFPAGGVLNPSVFVTRITDRDGKVLYDIASEQLKSASQVISPQSAFIMSNLLRGAVESGTGIAVKALGRPAAGKTGTSNDEMDAWFVGFTPQWACGVWVGFDVKRRIGPKETGGRVSAPIFRDFMQDFLSEQEAEQYAKLVEERKEEAQKLGIEYVEPDKISPPEFMIPEGIKAYQINKASGVEVPEGSPGAYTEYFVEGSEPNRSYLDVSDAESYLESPEL